MRLLSVIGLFAVIVGLCAPSAEGTSIFISYIEASQICSGSKTDLNFSGPAPLTYSTTCVPTTGATIGVSAEGSLSTVRLALDTAGPSQNTGATVRTRDTITATGGTGNGTLVFRWAIDGSLAADDTFLTQFYITDVTGAPVADYRACGQNALGLPCFSHIANVAVYDTATASVPFAFGSPVIVDWSFGALIDCTIVNSPCSAATGTGTNAVHFFNTAQLQPLVVLDGNGNQVLGASVLSDSGYNYAIASVAADLSVTKTDSPDPVIRGDNITYIVIVKNNGPSAATDVSLSDVVPSDAKFVSNSGATGWSCINPPTKGARTGAITCTKASLASGASDTFTIVLEVNAGTKATTISNTAAVSSGTSDPNPGNNAATATTTVKAHR